MELGWLDATVGVLVLLGFVHGVVKGAIQEISGALAIVVGIVAAGYVTAGTSAYTDGLSHPVGAKVFVFIATFVAAALLIGLLGKVVSGLARAANLNLIDRIVGGVVGACVVGIAIGIIIALLGRLGVDTGVLRESTVVRYLLQAVSHLARFLPEGTEGMEGADLPL